MHAHPDALHVAEGIQAGMLKGCHAQGGRQVTGCSLGIHNGPAAEGTRGSLYHRL